VSGVFGLSASCCVACALPSHRYVLTPCAIRGPECGAAARSSPAWLAYLAWLGHGPRAAGTGPCSVKNSTHCSWQLLSSAVQWQAPFEHAAAVCNCNQSMPLRYIFTEISIRCTWHYQHELNVHSNQHVRRRACHSHMSIMVCLHRASSQGQPGCRHSQTVAAHGGSGSHGSSTPGFRYAHPLKHGGSPIQHVHCVL
jgi:hypothetical protein